MKAIVYISLFVLFLSGCVSDDHSLQSTSWSEANIVSLCDSSENKMAAPDLVLSYNGKSYYNKEVNKSDHEIHVSFDFISDCCREFEIDTKLAKDQLYIKYHPKDGDVCECKCNYRGIVKIGDSEIDFQEIKRVVIKRSL